MVGRVPDYTLAPDASLKGIVSELRLAFDWLQRHRATYNIGGPIILSGWSAGGHLAALLLDHPCIAAGFAISGVYELGPIRDIYLNEREPAPHGRGGAHVVTARLTQSAKPLDVVYGTRGLTALAESSRALHAKRSSLVPAPGHDHFSVLQTLCDPGGLLPRCALNLHESLL
jgi:arylformamidase